jgi:serine/threonine protein kinase
MSNTILRSLNIEARRPVADVQLGSIIKDRFIIEEKIGVGGMGTVYKARDKRREEANLESPFIAIKILNPEIRNHSRAFVVLQHEAVKAQALSHPNIVRIHDFDREGELAFLTMEYLEGVTLADLLKNPKKYPLTSVQKFNIIRQLLVALEYAHQHNCIHADLKPSNIFVLKNASIKIIDFGIANAVTEIPQNNSINKFLPESLQAYSSAYATTEIIIGKKPDIKDDLYAVSCIIYQLLSRQHPYENNSAQRALSKNLVAKPIQQLSRKQWQVLRQGLALNSQQRRATIRQLLTIFSQKNGKNHHWLWFLGTLTMLALLLIANHFEPIFR